MMLPPQHLSNGAAQFGDFLRWSVGRIPERSSVSVFGTGEIVLVSVHVPQHHAEFPFMRKFLKSSLKCSAGFVVLFAVHQGNAQKQKALGVLRKLLAKDARELSGFSGSSFLY
jgi:hypothetical protein